MTSLSDFFPTVIAKEKHIVLAENHSIAVNAKLPCNQSQPGPSSRVSTGVEILRMEERLTGEKGHWETQIKSLGGPDYAKNAQKTFDAFGAELSTENGSVASPRFSLGAMRFC